jgi:hypothetical protein
MYYYRLLLFMCITISPVAKGGRIELDDRYMVITL